LAGLAFAIGGDDVAKGIAIFLAVVVVGALGTLPAAVFITYLTFKRASVWSQRLHAVWPWIIIFLFWLFLETDLLRKSLDVLGL
jgi:phosphate/sulfate permease